MTTPLTIAPLDAVRAARTIALGDHLPRRPAGLGWVLASDQRACAAAAPVNCHLDSQLVLARVAERTASRPALLLPLIGGWLAVVLVLQIWLQPRVARLVGPVEALGLAGCALGWVGSQRGWLSPAATWTIVSTSSCLQAAAFVMSYFLTDYGAYQTAIVVDLLAVAVLDVRSRAMQLIAIVVVASWSGCTAIAPTTHETIWNLLVVLGACSAALVAHQITMRTTYAAEWLRLVDERRADEVSDALTETQRQLRHRQRAERRLAKVVLELQSAQAQLLQTHKLEAIGQLAAGVAHEINTPTQFVSDNVTFLQGAFPKLLAASVACRAALESAQTPDADLAREALARARLDYHSKQVPRALEQSLDGLQRISSLVAALKEFSHPSAGVKSPIDLNQAIETTIAIARNEWKYVAEVTTELDAALPAVSCLRDELNQVILNLLVNAAHAVEGRVEGAPLGKIRVRTRNEGDHAIIEVADDGAGIPEEIRHRIFEPFFTTKPMGKGTGQGLAISRGVIVDKHQGTIVVDSQLGRGTTFTIRIPIEAPGHDHLL